MAKNFYMDNLQVHVSSLNVRKERHGEALITALDLSMESSPEIPSVLLRALLDSEEEVAELMSLIGADKPLDSVEFKADFEDHRVKLRVSTDEVALFPSASLNKFSVWMDKKVPTLWVFGFRVQTLRGDADLNDISDHIQQLVCMDCGPAQGDLELENADERQPELA